MDAKTLSEMFEPDEMTIREVKKFGKELLALITKYMDESEVSMPQSSPQRTVLIVGIADYLKQLADHIEVTAAIGALAQISHKRRGA